MGTKTFLVGERISLADIGMAMTLLPAFTEVLDQAFRSSHRHLTRWFNTIIHQELVVKVIGTVKLCVKEAEMKQGAKKDKKEKASKPEKKKEEPKKKKDDTKKPTEEPMEMPAEPKKTDPLDPLPKGTFDLEDWKRFYSNNDEDKSCEYFGPSLTPPVTLSGEGTTGITRSSVRSSCLATSWEECSRGWRSSRKTHSHLPCSLARTTIAPSLLFGFSKDSS